MILHSFYSTRLVHDRLQVHHFLHPMYVKSFSQRMTFFVWFNLVLHGREVDADGESADTVDKDGEEDDDCDK